MTKIIAVTGGQMVHEHEVRVLRDLVYGRLLSDLSWQEVKINWMRPDSFAWLKEKSKKPMSEFLK